MLREVRRGLGGETLSFVARLNAIAYEVFLMPVRDEAGEISGVIGVSTDVTCGRNTPTSWPIAPNSIGSCPAFRRGSSIARFPSSTR